MVCVFIKHHRNITGGFHVETSLSHLRVPHCIPMPNCKRVSLHPLIILSNIFTIAVLAKAYLISPTNSLNFSENWGMQRNKAEFHEFQGLILLHFCYSRSKIAIILTIFTEKHVKFLEISLETIIRGNWYVTVADFDLKKRKKAQSLSETLTPISSF